MGSHRVGHDWSDLAAAAGLRKAKVKVKSLNRVRLFVTPWTVAYQASLSMGFSRQEYWSGLPFSRVSSQPRDWTRVSLIACRCFTRWAKWTSSARFNWWPWGTYLSHPGCGESSITRAKGIVDRKKNGSHIGICRMTLHPVNTTYCPHLKINQSELQPHSHLGSPGEHQR